MKKIVVLILGLIIANAVFAQMEKSWHLNIDSVNVVARRVLRDVGVQQTRLDSLALRDNVTVSLADILTQNTTIFIKSYGRATLSTASVRGTSPSHTQVLWNGMKINSPMLGMVDFSLIPSYFIDDANVYYGASSVGVTGGGLGGAISLNTKPNMDDGFSLRYIQGVGCFDTYDQFLQASYAKKRFKSSTRVAYTTSDNDFEYTNRNKEGHPTERNKLGYYKDFHALQEFYYALGDGSNIDISAWYLNSRRGVPMLNVDYRDESKTKNEQVEQTLRTTGSWSKSFNDIKLIAKLGYNYTDLRYEYAVDNGLGELNTLTLSQSYVNTLFAKFDTEYYIGKRWMIYANVAANYNSANSADRLNDVGYDKSRFDGSLFASAKYRPNERLGFAVHVREDVYGSKYSPVIPAFFADYLISKKHDIKVKFSIARNYRYPTLNDLYFVPGGNDSLRAERGYTYDGGIEFNLTNSKSNLKIELTAFNSNISDWILWLPTFKGLWTPRNVERVRSYGAEAKAKFHTNLNDDWQLTADANFALTNSINKGRRENWADESIGKQLVYVPKYSAAATAKIAYRKWAFTYKWTYYSRRYTTTSNDVTSRYGSVPRYFMNDIAVEKRLDFAWARLSLKIAVNNIFDKEYETVLSRPMPGRNYSFFIEISKAHKSNK